VSAQKLPVVLTRHGRDDMVLMSVGDYQRLAEEPRAYYADEAPARVLDLMTSQRMSTEHDHLSSETGGERD